MIHARDRRSPSRCLFDHLSTERPGSVDAVRTDGSVRQMSQGDVCRADADKEDEQNEEKERV